MSQLSLFDAPADVEEEKPRSKEFEPLPKEPKPKPTPKPEPPPEEPGPIHATVEDTERPSWQCIVISCAAVTRGAEIDGHPICDLHNTDRTREVMATGSWPAWYGYEGVWSICPTVRRLDNLGHSWSSTGRAGRCENCDMTYTKWNANQFETPCNGYEQPDTTKGLFRP